MNVSLKNQMSPNLISVAFDCSIEKALMVMKSHHFRHLPVVNELNQIIGIVSDRDLYRGLNTDEVNVQKVLTTDIQKIDIKTDLREVLIRFIKFKISALLVTDADIITGIITSEDMLHLLLQFLNESKENPTLLEDFIKKLQEYSLKIGNPSLITTF